MLVLSRKSGETIHVGDDIVIEIRKVSGNRVSVGITAPRSTRILRGELQEAAVAFENDQVPQESPVGTHAPALATQEVTENYIVVHERLSAPASATHMMG